MDREETIVQTLDDILYDTEVETESVFDREQFVISMQAFNEAQQLRELNLMPQFKLFLKKMDADAENRTREFNAYRGVDDKKLAQLRQHHLCATYARDRAHTIVEDAESTPRPVLVKPQP